MKSHTLSTELSTEIPQKTQIIVVIVHFGDAAPTDALVHSLCSGSVIPKVIIVDHDPIPYTAPVLGVECIRPTENLGYFAGLQAGIDYSARFSPTESDIYILLNNDVRVSFDSIQRIRGWWATQASRNTIAGPFFGDISLLTGRANVRPPRTSSLFHAPYIHGACIVGEYAVLRSLPFTRFFMYWEDAALSLWAARRRMYIRHIPQANIEHDDEPEPLSDTKLYYLVRNGAYVLETLTGPLWGLYWRVGNRIRLMYHALQSDSKHATIVRALTDARSKIFL